MQNRCFTAFVAILAVFALLQLVDRSPKEPGRTPVSLSDARLKSDVESLDYGLKEVMLLRPVSYRWKGEEGGQRVIGLIAQETEELVPEVVETFNDGDATKGIRYAELVALLIHAAQQQQGQIEMLRQKIERMQSAENPSVPAQ